MPAPTLPNTTCDVYRSGKAPPTLPDLTAIQGTFTAIYMQGLERGEGDSDTLKYTHKLLVASNIDIRDAYNAGTIGSTADTVYIPDRNGTAFNVIFTEIVNLGQPWQHKRVYLARKSPTYPTNNL